MVVKKLDSTPIKNIDFLKIDAQGSEFKILQGSKNQLKNCLGLEIETEFSYIYKNQPLFQDISNEINKRNFEFIDFVSIVRWERDNFSGFGQFVFGESLYLRSPEYVLNFFKDNEEKIYKYISIYCLYGRFDLVDIILEKYFKKQKDEILTKINRLKKYHFRLRKMSLYIESFFKCFGKNFKTHFIY